MSDIEPMPEFNAFGPAAHRVIALAGEEAARLEHGYLGTEHILLGLLREEESAAAKALAALDVDVEKVRAEIDEIVQADLASSAEIELGPRARRVVELAHEEFRGLAAEPLNFDRNPDLPQVPRGDDLLPEHLLIGLLRVEESVAEVVFQNLGLDYETVAAELAKTLG